MNTTRKTKLIYRFLLFILPLLAVSIIVTSVILSWTSYNYFLKTINQNYANIIKSSAGEIRLFVHNAHKGLEELARVIAATKLDVWQKEMALTAFNHTRAEFMSVSLVSAQGESIVSVGEAGHNLSLSKDKTFARALAGEVAISDVILTKESMPQVYIGVPVTSLGVVREVLWAGLNLKHVWDVLEGVEVGRTGQVYIMDLSGRYLGHREIDRVVKPTSDQQHDITEKLQASDSPVSWVEEKDGVKLYCMGALVSIRGRDWAVVLSQECPEIYAYIYQNIYWSLFITCLVSVGAVLIGWNRIKYFLVPVRTLHRQVERIAAGDLEQKVSVDTQDEIGDLGLAFNEMTASLKRYIEREVETAKELAHAKNLAVLGSASSKVTHEVGNLLNNLEMALFALKSEALGPGGERVLQIIEKDAVRVRDFIRNFLQFAKKPEPRLQRTQIGTIIEDLMFIHQPSAENKGISLELNWPSNLPSINIDASLIYQALNNLIKNSLEAMADTGYVRIEGKLNREYLVITVSDTGPGIESNALEQVFDPFFTTKGAKGTGLGLSIVKMIIDSHQGTIECLSEPEKGTTFVVCLPLQ